jgi:archaellum component FlaC
MAPPQQKPAAIAKPAARPAGQAAAQPQAAQQQAQAAGAQSLTPKVDGFKIKAKMTGQAKDIADTLRTISFLEVAPERDAVNVVYVESRDINKNPYLFSILKLKKDELEVLYSIPPEIAPRKRRLDVIRYLLNILTLVESSFPIDNKVLYQLIESAVKDLLESVTMDYSKLYTAYDSVKKDADDLRKKVERLQEQAEALTTKNYELKASNDETALRIQELEVLSDDALKAKLQEWVIEHNGEINVIEFTKVYKVPEARIEQMLNRLVAEGYLEVLK